jgi:hypothetical protein
MKILQKPVLVSLTAIIFLLFSATYVIAQATPISNLPATTDTKSSPEILKQPNEVTSVTSTSLEETPTFKPVDSIANFIEYYLPVFVPLAIAFLGVIFGIAAGRIDLKFTSIIQSHIDMALGLFSFVLWAYIAGNKDSIILLNSDTELKSTRVTSLLICDLFLIAISIILVTQKRMAANREKFRAELSRQEAVKQTIHNIKELYSTSKSINEDQLDLATEKAIKILDEYRIGIPINPELDNVGQQRTEKALNATHKSNKGLIHKILNSISTQNGKLEYGTRADTILFCFTLFFLFLPIMLSTHITHKINAITDNRPSEYLAIISYHHISKPDHPKLPEQFDSEDIVATNSEAALDKAIKLCYDKHPQANFEIDRSRSVAGPPSHDFKDIQ